MERRYVVRATYETTVLIDSERMGPDMEAHLLAVAPGGEMARQAGALADRSIRGPYRDQAGTNVPVGVYARHGIKLGFPRLVGTDVVATTKGGTDEKDDSSERHPGRGRQPGASGSRSNDVLEVGAPGEDSQTHVSEAKDSSLV